MPQTPAPPRPGEIAWMQQAALLDTTLTRIIRYAQLMQSDLRKAEVNVAHADQMGRSVLTVLREAAGLTARAEIAAREGGEAAA